MIKVATAGTQLGLHLLLARLMGAEPYGIYVYVFAWLNILTVLCLLGFQTSLVRFVAEYNIKQQWGLIRGLLRFSSVFAIGLGACLGLLGVAVIGCLRGRLSDEMAVTLCVAAGGLPLMVLCRLRQASLRALKRVAQAEMFAELLRPVLMIFLVFVGYFILGRTLKAYQVMAALLVAVCGVTCIGVLLLRKHLPLPVRQTTPAYHRRNWLAVSLPLWLVAGSGILLSRVDVLMLGAYCPTEQIGYYSVAVRISILVGFALVAVNSILAPIASELFHSGRKDQLQRVMTLAARGVFGFTLLVSIILAVFGKFLLSLFGAAFVMAYCPLLILLCGQIANAMAGSVGLILMMTNRQNQAGRMIVLTLIVNIILNAFLIPRLGILGAAVATASSMTLQNTLMLFYVYRYLGLNPTVIVRRRCGEG